MKNKVTSTPFLDKRIKFRNMMYELVNTKNISIMFGLLGMIIGLAGVSGSIYTANQSKFIPVIISQDEVGNTVGVYSVEKLPEASEKDFEKVCAVFIENIRLVSADKKLQEKAVKDLYSFLKPNDPATNKANDYLNSSQEANPFNRAQKELVSVEIINVLKLTENSYQVDWVEKINGLDGRILEKPYNMKAIINVYQGEPTPKTTKADVLRNPHFINVKDFNWSRNI